METPSCLERVKKLQEEVKELLDVARVGTEITQRGEKNDTAYQALHNELIATWYLLESSRRLLEDIGPQLEAYVHFPKPIG